MIWGQLGDIVFEYMTSPVYGSVVHHYSAKYTQHPRIISRDPVTQLLKGQKPKKEIAGLSLITVSFDCRVSTLVLKKLQLGLAEQLALAAGAGGIAGSVIGDIVDDKSFYTDVLGFIGSIKKALTDQSPLPYLEGDIFHGDFTVNDLDVTEKHKSDGTLMYADLSLNLEEWVS